MCGIAGYFDPSGFKGPDATDIATSMRDRLVRRGPDDAGLWQDDEAGIALTHRRLSIIDLSPAGHQPMISATGRFVLVFNGEIYNYLDIRASIESAGAVSWRGHSDTETLLAAIELWGLERTLQACVGMFALALWDREERSLMLARDRMGEKPLYYGWQAGVLMFGSELKALQAHPAFGGEVNRDALPLFLRHGYIPAPHSIWTGIQKLPPGTFIQIDGTMRGRVPEPTPYWSMAEAIEQGQRDPFVGSDEEAINLLEQEISRSIAGQRIADVPLGAFLSGGIDSSTVVALMQAQASRPVKTFTIGFREEGYNEADHAKAVASHLGTDHTELYLTSGEAREIVPSLPDIYDEPFGDSSAIPTHLVSTLARGQVAVSLSGDGGDELFAGYSRYFNHPAMRAWRLGQNVPRFARGAMTSLLRSNLPRALAGAAVASKAAMLANLMESDTLSAYYRTMTSQWNPVPLAAPASRELSYGLPASCLNYLAEPVQQVMATDCVTYLPDDILAKVDRAAMAVSLETRVPLLDHRIVELAWRMPYGLKVREGQGKWLLRQVLYRHVPRALMDRPKMGFAVPVGDWLRGPLRDWSESLLDEAVLRQEGYLDPEPVRRRWNEHQKGQKSWRDSLWLLLMWQAWLKKNKV